MLNNLRNSNTLSIALKIIAGFIVYFLLITALIYVERDSQQSAITDYTNAIWFSIVTLTTVGYGDLFPATIYGRAISYIFILVSLGIYGILIGQFTNLMATIKEHKKLGLNGTNFESHAIIIGWNDFGKLVLEQLMGVGKHVAIVTNNKEDIDNIQELYKDDKIFTLYGDFSNSDLLNKANIELSSIVFVNLLDDTEKLVYILNLKKVFP
ncbi:MAG: voltage-gated potassium channel, partial [Marinoscillum sp.]